MRRPPPFSAAELRGLAQLATHATLGVSHIVEAMHHTIAKPWSLFRKNSERKMGGIPGFVYKTVRGGTRIAGGGVALGLRLLQLRAAQSTQTEANETKLAFISALNGVVGDHLIATKNPLAITMQYRVGEGFAATGEKLIVLVHGLCMNDFQWQHEGHDHGAVLARALKATPIYVRYNSGLPIAKNGAHLAALLGDLVKNWSQPVKEIIIVAHSMGGLVTRAACEQDDQSWRKKLKAIIFLGTPHAGAPLERGGHWVDILLSAIPYSAPFARLTRLRSAGITDLRHGNLAQPLPKGVRCYAIAGSLGAEKNSLVQNIAGDGLVPVASALGGGTLNFSSANTFVAQSVGHLDLLRDSTVSKKMIAWLAATKKPPQSI